MSPETLPSPDGSRHGFTSESMKSPLGYCTNVHAGATLDQARANLEHHALAVKQRFSPDAPMGIGLWYSASAARRLTSDRARLQTETAWLSTQELLPYTFNGFPFGDFHRDVVKHDVYVPTWDDPQRGEYTQHLIAILDCFLPPCQSGTISTLPLGWGSPSLSDALLRASASQLRFLVDQLDQLEQRTGRHVRLCLEPEPGCQLQRAGDVVSFFENYLLGNTDEALIRRHLGVCHDVCHSAVMFEPQTEAIETYRRVGITVGKVQVSSAVVVPEMTPEAREQLSHFNEPRYLHQTCVRRSPDVEPTFYEDLPDALASEPDGGEWRIHFHVPIYLESFGHLCTSRPDILECLRAMGNDVDDVHFEVETYAWNVLPEELQVPELADGIARELSWFRDIRDVGR